jgi:hypothetical protein
MNKEYREKNREKLKEHLRGYYQKNREKIKAQRKRSKSLRQASKQTD